MRRIVGAAASVVLIAGVCLGAQAGGTQSSEVSNRASADTDRPAPFPFRLTGTVIGLGVRHALFVPLTGGAPETVAVGGQLGACRLAGVEPARALMHCDGRALEIALTAGPTHIKPPPEPERVKWTKARIPAPGDYSSY